MSENPDAYKTIIESAEAEFSDRGSKFVAYLKHIESAEDFSDHLEEIKALHFKARHHCYGYRLLDTDQFRYNDDGEPSGTAGKPIYNQILSFDLVNVSCIVVRYFGGTKLGTSGLINAYKSSARLAIENANILQQFIQRQFLIEFDYGMMGKLMDYIKQIDLEIIDKRFDAKPSFVVKCNASEVRHKVDTLKSKMLNRSLSDISEETEVAGLDFIIDDKNN